MADASPWQYVVSFGDLRTGILSGQLPVSGASWTSQLNDAGSASGLTINMADTSLRGVNVRRLTQPARKFALIEYGPRGGTKLPVFAGPIWSQSYSRQTRKVSLSAAGMSSIFDHRKIVRALDADPAVAKTNLSYQDRTLAGLAVALVQQAMAYTGADLPIAVPPVVDSGEHDRQWFGWELPWAGELLSNLTNLENGPDIEFWPRRQAQDDNRVEWLMRVGDDSNPELRQDGPPWVWDDSVKDSPVTNITTDVDGSQMGTRVWVPGDGIESDRIIGSKIDQALTQNGWPMLDAEDTSRTSVVTQATLDGYATELLRARSRPQETWSITVHANRAPFAGQYRPGDYAAVHLRGDPFLPDGVHEVRILQISGAMDHRTTLTMAPTEGLL